MNDVRCPGCRVPEGVPCFAGSHGLADWCGDQERWGHTILGRSLGLIVDVQIRDEAADRRAEIRALARDCRHADKPWHGCACVDRLCNRENKIMSGLDCLLCAESGGTA